MTTLSYIGTMVRMVSHAAVPERDCFSQSGLPRRFGRYLLLKLLARGGMGQVFLASTTGVEGAERPMILKVIRREHARDPNFLARFLDEARVQAQLSHSAVAQVVEAAVHAPTGDPYVVLEYVEGKSLGSARRRIADVGLRLRWEEAVALGTLICEGLAHVHDRTDAAGRPLGIVHRDLSPHNVMVGYGGDVKIIDFGTARGQNRRCHTVAGVVFAKPGYVAPEVANGDSGDFRVDLYAAGVMLWELCAGRRFLQGDAQEHLARVAAGEGELPPIASRVGAPAALDEVIARMTAFDRDERFATSDEAVVKLAALLRHAPPLPNGERSVRARVAQLMYTLYPTQPARSRREFARLVEEARSKEPGEWESGVEAAALSTEPDLLPGTRYRLRREIGHGASSVVYQAEHVDLGRQVAIKVLDADHTHSREFAARFRREARALSRLTHGGLVRVLDFGQASDGRLYGVMELLEGKTVRRVMSERERPLDWMQALRITMQAASALHAAHQAGLVHRDVKPENLFLTDDGQVKVLDFGLAKTAGEIGEPPPSEDDGARPGFGGITLFGTPEYIAPEQIAGGRVDGRADVYSLGCVLYEMLTGRLPFTGASSVLMLDAKLKGNPEGVREVAPGRDVPRAVERLVMKALARHPMRRFSDAGELAAAARSLLEAPSRARARRRAAGASVLAAAMGFGLVLIADQVRPWLADLDDHLPWLRQPSLPLPSDEGQRPPAPRPEKRKALPANPYADEGRRATSELDRATSHDDPTE